MSVYFFISLPNDEYLNLLIVAVCLLWETPSSVKNSYLLTYPDDKAEILTALI